MLEISDDESSTATSTAGSVGFTLAGSSPSPNKQQPTTTTKPKSPLAISDSESTLSEVSFAPGTKHRMGHHQRSVSASGISATAAAASGGGGGGGGALLDISEQEDDPEVGETSGFDITPDSENLPPPASSSTTTGAGVRKGSISLTAQKLKALNPLDITPSQTPGIENLSVPTSHQPSPLKNSVLINNNKKNMKLDLDLSDTDDFSTPSASPSPKKKPTTTTAAATAASASGSGSGSGGTLLDITPSDEPLEVMTTTTTGTANTSKVKNAPPLGFLGSPLSSASSSPSSPTKNNSNLLASKSSDTTFRLNNNDSSFTLKGPAAAKTGGGGGGGSQDGSFRLNEETSFKLTSPTTAKDPNMGAFVESEFQIFSGSSSPNSLSRTAAASAASNEDSQRKEKEAAAEAERQRKKKAEAEAAAAALVVKQKKEAEEKAAAELAAKKKKEAEEKAAAELAAKKKKEAEEKAAAELAAKKKKEAEEKAAAELAAKKKKEAEEKAAAELAAKKKKEAEEKAAAELEAKKKKQQEEHTAARNKQEQEETAARDKIKQEETSTFTPFKKQQQEEAEKIQKALAEKKKKEQEAKEKKDQEERERKEREEKERKRIETLQGEIRQKISNCQQEEEPKARSPILQEHGDFVSKIAGPEFVKLLKQHLGGKLKEVESKQETEAREEISKDRQTFISETATSQFVQLLKKHLGELAAKLEKETETSARSNLAEDEEKARKEFLMVVKMTMSNESERLQHLLKQKKEREAFEKEIFEKEREKLSAEFNISVAGLRRKQVSLNQTCQREKLEFSLEEPKRKELETEESKVRTSSLFPVAVENQKLVRESFCVVHSRFCEKQVFGEFSREMDRWRDRLRGHLQRDVAKRMMEFEDTEEPQARAAIEKEDISDLSRIKSDFDFAAKVLSSELTFKELAESLVSSHKKLADKIEESRSLTLQQELFIPFLNDRLMLQQREAREQIEEKQEKKEALEKIKPALETMQNRTRTFFCDSLEKDARDSIGVNEYSQFVSSASADVRKLLGQNISALLNLLQQQEEPSARASSVVELEEKERKKEIEKPAAASMKKLKQAALSEHHSKLFALENEFEENIFPSVQKEREEWFSKDLPKAFQESLHRAQITEFLRYSEPPRRKEIRFAEKFQVEDVLIPQVLKWRQATRKFVETQFTRKYEDLSNESNLFFERVAKQTKEKREAEVDSRFLALQNENEPAARREIENEQTAELESKRQVFLNSVRFIARAPIAREEEKSRLKVQKEFEHVFSHFKQLHALTRAEHSSRALVVKIEGNVVETYERDLRNLNINNAKTNLQVRNEPGARSKIQQEEQEAFSQEIIQPHLLWLNRARALELEKKHKEIREEIVLEQQEESSTTFYPELQLLFEVAFATDNFMAEEKNGRDEIEKEEAEENDEFDKNYTNWLKLVLSAVFERRTLEKKAAIAMRTLIKDEMEEFSTRIWLPGIESLQFAFRLRLLLRSRLALKFLWHSFQSRESDKFIVSLKEEESRLLYHFVHDRHLAVMNIRRFEGYETLSRNLVQDEYVTKRRRMIVQRGFEDLEAEAEVKERYAIKQQEHEESVAIIDDFIKRSEILHRLDIFENQYRKRFVVSTAGNEQRRMDVLSEMYSEHNFLIVRQRKEWKTKFIPAVTALEMVGRRDIKNEWKLERSQISDTTGAQLIERNYDASRVPILKEEAEAVFEIFRAFVLRGESATRASFVWNEGNTRRSLESQLQLAGIGTWDLLVRRSIESQWQKQILFFERFEISKRAALLIEPEIELPEIQARKYIQDLAEQSLIFSQVLEERRMMRVRELLVRRDRAVSEFNDLVEASQAGIEAEEQHCRLVNLKMLGMQNGRFFAMACENKRLAYEQGLRDLAIIERWEWTEREEIVRRKQIIPEQEESLGKLVLWESRLFVESRYCERRAECFREFLVNPLVVDLLLWSRNVSCQHNVAKQEERERSLLQARHGMKVLEEIEEPRERRNEVAETEHRQRTRLTSHIFDRLSISFSDELVYQEESNERNNLWFRFQVGRLALKEEYFRKQLIQVGLWSLQGDDFSRALTEFEKDARAHIIQQEQEERHGGGGGETKSSSSSSSSSSTSSSNSSSSLFSCDLNAFSSLLKLQQQQDVCRNQLLEEQTSTRTFGILDEFVSDLQRLYRTQIASQESLTRCHSIEKIFIATTVVFSSEKLGRENILEQELSLRHSYERSCINQQMELVKEIIWKTWSADHRKEMQEIFDESVLECRERESEEERVRKDRRAGISSASLSSKFADTKGLPKRYTDLYLKQMHKPTELVQEEREKKEEREQEEFEQRQKLKAHAEGKLSEKEMEELEAEERANEERVRKLRERVKQQKEEEERDEETREADRYKALLKRMNSKNKKKTEQEEEGKEKKKEEQKDDDEEEEERKEESKQQQEPQKREISPSASASASISALSLSRPTTANSTVFTEAAPFIRNHQQQQHHHQQQHQDEVVNTSSNVRPHSAVVFSPTSISRKDLLQKLQKEQRESLSSSSVRKERPGTANAFPSSTALLFRDNSRENSESMKRMQQEEFEGDEKEGKQQEDHHSQPNKVLVPIRPFSALSCKKKKVVVSTKQEQETSLSSSSSASSSSSFSSARIFPSPTTDHHLFYKSLCQGRQRSTSPHRFSSHQQGQQQNEKEKEREESETEKEEEEEEEEREEEEPFLSRPTSACPSYHFVRTRPSTALLLSPSQKHQQQQQQQEEREKEADEGKENNNNNNNRAPSLVRTPTRPSTALLTSKSSFSRSSGGAEDVVQKQQKQPEAEEGANEHNRIQAALMSGARTLKQVSSSINIKPHSTTFKYLPIRERILEKEKTEPHKVIPFHSGLDTMAFPGSTSEIVVETSRSKLLRDDALCYEHLPKEDVEQIRKQKEEEARAQRQREIEHFRRLRELQEREEEEKRQKAEAQANLAATVSAATSAAGSGGGGRGRGTRYAKTPTPPPSSSLTAPAPPPLTQEEKMQHVLALKKELHESDMKVELRDEMKEFTMSASSSGSSFSTLTSESSSDFFDHLAEEEKEERAQKQQKRKKKQ